MLSQAKVNLRKYLGLLAFSLVFLAVSGFMQRGMLFGFPPAATMTEEASNSETLNKLKIASMQHDLILLLIDRNDLVTFMERTFNKNPTHASTVRYDFQIEDNDEISPPESLSNWL